MACIVTDPSGKTVLDEYEAKVFPKNPVDPEAARVNGYSVEKWAAEAVELDQAMYKLLSMARNSALVAHNAPFDWGFLQVAMARRGQRWPGDYHRICTVALATPLLKAGLIDNLKLGTLTQYFGIQHNNAHSALGDVHACREVYLKLMERYAPLFAPPATGGAA